MILVHRILVLLIGGLFALFVAGCGSDSSAPNSGSHDRHGHGTHESKPAGKSDPQYCAHNRDPSCPQGSYLGPFVTLKSGGGHWDANGQPVNGGPVGADGSTGNNLTQEFCAQNEDPACPIGSYVGPNAIQNPDGSPTYVVCDGTICTNPNHGAGGPPGTWGPNGEPINGGPVGADGSTGNNLTHEYCARNEDPACPVGTFVGANAIQNADGSNGYMPCEGTICTNPNHGAGGPPGPPAGEEPADVAPPEPGPADEGPADVAPPEPGPDDSGDDSVEEPSGDGTDGSDTGGQ